MFKIILSLSQLIGSRSDDFILLFINCLSKQILKIICQSKELKDNFSRKSHTILSSENFLSNLHFSFNSFNSCDGKSINVFKNQWWIYNIVGLKFILWHKQQQSVHEGRWSQLLVPWLLNIAPAPKTYNKYISC